jgi:hypothetical protein
MRYLNKIIFINSAQIKYAEINLDGNVHFIGTQGVGKSTVLRSILFFYNADTFGLGIPKQKDTYTDYYFKNSNSYIIYEVVRGDSKFCVVSYKSQHKVCFRFFDGEYQQKYFVSETGNVPDSWEGIAQQLDLNRIFYTKRKIDDHKEYRDILYGNHDGKKNELKRYSIIESKEYQYIPKTIQNVFLNSKMDAEFIKQTIIMSLENDIRIDLNQHAHHLNGFETQLNDIRKFKTPTTTAQALSISKLHFAIEHLQREKIQLAKELAWALNKLQEDEPILREKLDKQKDLESICKLNISKTLESYNNKEKKKLSELSVFDDKLKTAKKILAEYENKNINQIIDRVSKKPFLDKEQKNLNNEKELLSIQFRELSQKFQALLDNLENQLNDFLNRKTAEKNKINSESITFKDETRRSYERLISEIKTEQQNAIENLTADWEQKKLATNKLKLKKEGIKHIRFFEKEITEFKSLIVDLQSKKLKLTSDTENSKREIETFEKQWRIDEKDLQNTFEREKEKFDDQHIIVSNRILEIDSYLENSKNSFYGWLTEQYPGWEYTIGKVIDEKTILFNTSLSPKLTSKSNEFYGVELDLNEVDKVVNTVADYENEKKVLNEKVIDIKKLVLELTEKTEKDKENFRRKYQPKIRERKSAIKDNVYLLEQNQIKTGESTVKLNDFISIAEIEKTKELENISQLIQQSTEFELVAKNEIDKINEELSKSVKAKEREREKRNEERDGFAKQLLIDIDKEIDIEKQGKLRRQNEINAQKQKDISRKGVDTERLSEIEKRLEILNAELLFIEDNRDTVTEYKKDKREFIDKVEDFKNHKQILEKQLDNEKRKYQQQKDKINKDLVIVEEIINELVQKQQDLKEDNDTFETFKSSDCYYSIKNYFTNSSIENSSEKRVKNLIDEIKEVHYDRLHNRVDEIRKTTTDFLGKFSEDNIFKFKKQLTDDKSFLDFAMMLSDFVEENKIDRIEKEVNERFALIITTIGIQTNSLVSESGKIQSVIKKINDDFIEKNFVGAIKKIELKIEDSKNEVVQLLIMIKKYNDDNYLELGTANLFSSENQEKKNKDAIDILKQFVKKISELKRDYISLSDSFELKFRIEENQNDTGWVEKLSNVGSDGTDVLVKAMVNIMLLNVFKEGVSKRFKDFQLHCMMDEIGKLHPNNVRGILKFANDRNILLINSSPIENDALAFKHIYKLKKDNDGNNTKVNRILTQYTVK